MEIQLRVVLLIVGMLILCGVAIDFFRRRPSRQSMSYTSSSDYTDNELLRTIAGSKEYSQQASYDDVADIEAAPVRINPALDGADQPSKTRILIDDYEFSGLDPIGDEPTHSYEQPKTYQSSRAYEPSRSYEQSSSYQQSGAYEQEIYAEPVITKPVAPPPPAIAPQDIVAIHIMSRVRGGFAGEELYTAICNANLYLGNNNIFQRHENEDGTGEPLFCLLKAVEPGYFDLDLLPRQKVPGVTLLLIKTQVKDPLLALDKMVRAAKQIAFALNGELLDHERQALTLTKIDSYKENLQK